MILLLILLKARSKEYERDQDQEQELTYDVLPRTKNHACVFKFLRMTSDSRMPQRGVPTTDGAKADRREESRSSKVEVMHSLGQISIDGIRK